MKRAIIIGATSGIGKSLCSELVRKGYMVGIYLEGLRISAEKSKLFIQVTDIRPGFVDTDMAKGEGMFSITRVDRAAKQISDAIQKRRKVVYVSKRWRLVALLLSLVPYQIYRKL